jgi:hypothetical protein
MDYFDAVIEILDKASRIKLPGHKISVVTEARRQFGRNGACDAKFIDPIERFLKECLRSWTPEQKRSIWESTEAGAGLDFEDYDMDSIEMDLEGELLFEIIEELAGNNRRADVDDPDK